MFSTVVNGSCTTISYFSYLSETVGATLQHCHIKSEKIFQQHAHTVAAAVTAKLSELPEGLKSQMYEVPWDIICENNFCHVETKALFVNPYALIRFIDDFKHYVYSVEKSVPPSYTLLKVATIGTVVIASAVACRYLFNKAINRAIQIP